MLNRFESDSAPFGEVVETKPFFYVLRHRLRWDDKAAGKPTLLLPYLFFYVVGKAKSMTFQSVHHPAHYHNDGLHTACLAISAYTGQAAD